MNLQSTTPVNNLKRLYARSDLSSLFCPSFPVRKQGMTGIFTEDY